MNDAADDDGWVAALLVDVGEYFSSLCRFSFISGTAACFPKHMFHATSACFSGFLRAGLLGIVA